MEIRKWVDSFIDQFPRFVVQDQKYNYISARFPGDAQALAEKVVALVQAQGGADQVFLESILRDTLRGQ